jgi:ribonuclease T1
VLGRLVPLLVAAALLAPAPGAARDSAPHGRAEAHLAELPSEARETLALLKRGGPFPYRKDGTVFFNREQRLPRQPRGYYTEYTVRTPHARDRGPRRIVAGRGPAGDPATSGEYWYTDDHYETFRRIRE